MLYYVAEIITYSFSRVYFEVTDVAFLRPLESIRVTVLPSDVVFECVLSRPGMTLIWSKDGRDLTMTSRCVYSVVGEGDQAFCVHRLRLCKIGPFEEGLYAARLATGLKSEAFLSVECPPKINYEGPLGIDLVAGKSTIIEVPYSGAPAPEVNWSLNAGPLPVGPDRKIPLTSIDTVYGLTCLRVRHATREANGVYKVMVSTVYSLVSTAPPPSSPSSLACKLSQCIHISYGLHAL